MLIIAQSAIIVSLQLAAIEPVARQSAVQAGLAAQEAIMQLKHSPAVSALVQGAAERAPRLYLADTWSGTAKGV